MTGTHWVTALSLTTVRAAVQVGLLTTDQAGIMGKALTVS